MSIRQIVLLSSLISGLATCVQAQPRGPAIAEITPLVATDAVHAGGEAQVALKVRLPEGYHTNSNKPRDTNLIPITLTVSPPDGVTAAEIVWPEATDLKQRGADQPLRVFEREFTI